MQSPLRLSTMLVSPAHAHRDVGVGLKVNRIRYLIKFGSGTIDFVMNVPVCVVDWIQMNRVNDRSQFYK